MAKFPSPKLIEKPLLEAIIKRGGSINFSKDGRVLEIDLANYFHLPDEVRDFTSPKCKAKGNQSYVEA